jgi:hypothetical protein
MDIKQAADMVAFNNNNMNSMMEYFELWSIKNDKKAAEDRLVSINQFKEISAKINVSNNIVKSRHITRSRSIIKKLSNNSNHNIQLKGKAMEDDWESNQENMEHIVIHPEISNWKNV